MQAMLFDNPEDFVGATDHAVTLFGMSGVGKTRISAMLRRKRWFHFSVDYRIGTHYMGEYIVDNFKRHAMQVPFLRDLLRSDSIYISSNITFDNLEPLSTYLGAPGNPARNGLPLQEYQRRQEQHRLAEIQALLDIPYFIEKAKALYGYGNFVADTGGSLIEVIDLASPEDQVAQALAGHTVLVYIRGSAEDTVELVSRYRNDPKPMYYRPELLVEKWREYKALNGITDDNAVDPADFAAWGFEAILHDRLPRYQALADRFGYTVEARDVADLRDQQDFFELMRGAIAARCAA
jgi:hypothetical protein